MLLSAPVGFFGPGFGNSVVFSAGFSSEDFTVSEVEADESSDELPLDCAKITEGKANTCKKTTAPIKLFLIVLSTVELAWLIGIIGSFWFIG